MDLADLPTTVVMYEPFSVSGEIAEEAAGHEDDPQWAVAEVDIDEGGNPAVEILADGMTYTQAVAWMEDGPPAS